MGLFDKLFGSKRKPNSVSDNSNITDILAQTEKSNQQATSKEVFSLVSEAVGIIEAHVQILPEGVIVKSTGSESEVMEAAHKIEIAHNLQPENEIIHYAYASALHLAMQNKSAEDVMKKCATSHHNFLLAQLAVEGWNNWKSPFILPSWGKEADIITSAISQRVISCILLSTRDYILPRATLFFRDTGGDFDNLQALSEAKILYSAGIRIN